MTQDEYIKAVKVKLDEVSPFDDPTSFINSSVDSNVNPVITYIKNELPHASKFCLNDLPLSLLAKDIEISDEDVYIDRWDVGHIEDWDVYRRLTRVSMRNDLWGRDCTAFISSSDSLYLLQQNRITRGGYSKPIVAVVPEKQELELYSFPGYEHCCCCCCEPVADVFYVNVSKDYTKIKSDISDYIVIKCAAMVATILENPNGAAALLQEYNNKLNAILK